MQLTLEQQAVLDTNTNLVINAVAGSGKTSTLIAYAQSRPIPSKILYLAFNKTVKAEAIQKFATAGLKNVRVETAHSLAYDHIVKHSGYSVSQGMKSYEWCDILKIKTGDRHSDFIIANHVNKFLSFFCNSQAKKVEELNYAAILTDPKAATFVNNFYAQIERLTREALQKMDNGEIAISHDFYLKKFQLSEPTLSFDYILFDEGQDASAAMLDVFLRQVGTKIIVGDMHQQIYGWRYAINSLQRVNFPVFHLSNSFRFDEEVALVANKILSWKRHLQQAPAVKIAGVGSPSDIDLTRAILGRTNLGLLTTAISKWEQGQFKNLYFEGNINSYTFAEEGASLYDVLNLYNGRSGNIRDKLIAGMKSMKELEDYIEKTEDSSLSMIVEVVKEFGNRLPSLINELKSHHTINKSEADIIFSTVHRCKGMEYDEVTLLKDFINEERLKRAIEQNRGNELKEPEKNRLAEEINVLYVAATRAKNKLCIPPEINPLRSIEVVPSTVTAASTSKSFGVRQNSHQDFHEYWNDYKGRSGRFDYGRNKMKPSTYGRKWTIKEEDEVLQLFAQKIPIQKIGEQFDRSAYAIKKKLISLGVDVEDIV